MTLSILIAVLNKLKNVCLHYFMLNNLRNLILSKYQYNCKINNVAKHCKHTNSTEFIQRLTESILRHLYLPLSPISRPNRLSNKSRWKLLPGDRWRDIDTDGCYLVVASAAASVRLIHIISGRVSYSGDAHRRQLHSACPGDKISSHRSMVVIILSLS